MSHLVATSHPLSVGSNNHAITGNPLTLGATYTSLSERNADTAFHSSSANVGKTVAINEITVTFYRLDAITPTWTQVTWPTYRDIAERDADTTFNTDFTNVNRVVRVEDADAAGTVGYFALESVTPTWTELSSSGLNEFVELIDTPSSYAGQAFMVLRVNVGETGIEFSTAGQGDVVGTVSSTNNAIARYDGVTGLLIQNSLPTIGDTGIISNVTNPVAAQDAATMNYVDVAVLWQLDSNTVSPKNTNRNVAIGSHLADQRLDIQSTDGSAAISLTALGTDQDVFIKFEFVDDLGVFVLGVDDSDGDKFKIGTTSISVNTRFTIDSAGLIGIGTTTPNNLLDIHSATLDAALAITSLGTDTDPLIKFELADNVATFTIGVDDSDGGKFKIGTTGLSPTRLTIDNTGLVGIGTATPDTRLHVQGTSGGTAQVLITTDTDTVGEISTLAFSIPANDPQSGMKGTTRSAGVMDLALFVQSASGGGNRFDAITILGLTGRVGIGDTIPDNMLDVQGSGETAIAITAVGGDPIIKFELTDNVATFSMGIDDSDADKFKIGTTALAVNTRLTIDSAGNVGIGTTSPASPLEVDGIVRLTPNNNNHLFLGSMNDASSDGGRIIFDGGGSNDDWLIDLFFQDMRIFPTSGNSGFVRIFNGDGGVTGLKVEGNTTLGSEAGTPLSTLDVMGTLGLKRVGVGGSITTVNEIIIGVTDTSAPRTITLQTVDAIAGRIYIVKDESGGAGTNNITIVGEGGETIDGASSLIIASNFGGAMLYSDNVNWFVMAKT